MTVVHWKRRKENYLHLLTRINAATCKLQAIITHCFDLFYTTRNINITSFFKLLWHNLEPLSHIPNTGGRGGGSTIYSGYKVWKWRQHKTNIQKFPEKCPSQTKKKIPQLPSIIILISLTPSTHNSQMFLELFHLLKSNINLGLLLNVISILCW